ncbi:unnamed protein product [Brassica oleracea]
MERSTNRLWFHICATCFERSRSQVQRLRHYQRLL